MNEPPVPPAGRLAALKVLRACVWTTQMGSIYYSHTASVLKKLRRPVS
jgi:hypothetical protein